MSAPQLSNKDSARIYLEILRLEHEREEREAAEAAKKQAELHIEKEAGRKFLAKVMAKKQRNLKENPTSATADPTGQSASSQDKELNPPPQSYPISEKPPAKDPGGPASLVCPPGFGPLRKVQVFALKLTPPECCGGPRTVEVVAPVDRVLLEGKVDSETEVYLRKPVEKVENSEEEPEEMENLITLKTEPLTPESTRQETVISFPEKENLAYLCKTKVQGKMTSYNKYEVESGEGYSNHFSFDVELEKCGLPKRPQYVFKIVNPAMCTVATIVLSSNYQAAEVICDESLWPSQKAVVIACGFYMIWDTIQDIRRRAAIIKAIVICSFIFILLVLFIVLLTYDWEAAEESFKVLTSPPAAKKNNSTTSSPSSKS